MYKMVFLLVSIATIAGLVAAKQGESCSDDLLDMVCTSRLRNKHPAHTSKNDNDNNQPKTNYAFTAALSSYSNLAANQVIKFDYVWLNEGKIYNSSTGVFTVPRSGLYMVSASVMSARSQKLRCHLWLNKAMHVGVFGTNYSQGALNAVMRLTKGDELMIKHDNEGTKGIIGGHWSMFSAYIISE